MTATAYVLNSDYRVPDDLTERDQWVLWRFETRNGRPTKVPYQVTDRLADVSRPATWTTFEDVLNEWRRNPRRYSGLGFVFCNEDPFAGIDLDDSLDDRGAVKAWARGIVERFSDTYMETSSSGKGLKIWARGLLPANLPGVKVGEGAIELYDHARYFTVTGRAYRGAPLQVEDHADDLLALYQRLTGGRRGWPLQPLSGGRIPHGQQHNTLVSICGTLRRRGVCDTAILACLQIVNREQCEKPGSPDDVKRIVESSRRWGIK
jgi:hypothetical protein